MATSPINLTNRLTGMSSGIDTDALIKSMMQIEQLKLNRQLRSISTMQWKQETYTTVNDDLKAFMNDFTSVLGSNTMMKSGNYVTYNAVVTGDKASAVTISGSADAYAGTTTINSITQLATAAKTTSTVKVSKGSELSESNTTALGELNFAKALEFENGKISFAINGEVFTFKSTDSLQTVINTVNSGGAGVNMVYSRLTDEISFESKGQGITSLVTIYNIAGNAFGVNSAFGIDNGTYENGQDALLNINGIDVRRSSNSFAIDGINYTLNSTFAATDGPVTIKLTQNSDNAVDTIKKFVDGYNTLIKKLTDLTTTRKTREQSKYVPLTEDEKSTMTEDQIKQWDAIAKTGLLYNDAGISGLISNLRSALYDSIEGLGVSAADIGLRTAPYAKNGEISLDETALRNALEKNPHQVMNVFMKISNSESASTAHKENGLLYRINGLMNTYMKGAAQSSLGSLETSVFSASKKLGEMEKKMLNVQEKLYLKYAALETAMSKMQSQSSWLSSMLGQTTN